MSLTLLIRLKPGVHFAQWICCLIVLFLCACAGKTLATSELDAIKWKSYESRLKSKVISFEFPVATKGMNFFEFNPGMPPPRFVGDPRDEIRVISLQSGLDVDWIHVTKKLGMGIYLIRKKPESSHDNDWVQRGGNYWRPVRQFPGLEKNSMDEGYLTDMKGDYALLYWISADNVNEEERAGLERITQRVLQSIKIRSE